MRHAEYEIEPIVVDTLIYSEDWAKGYLNGQLVVEYGGVTDINAIELYNEKGERVIPTPQPPEGDPILRVELALAELAELIVNNIGGV